MEDNQLLNLNQEVNRTNLLVPYSCTDIVQQRSVCGVLIMKRFRHLLVFIVVGTLTGCAAPSKDQNYRELDRQDLDPFRTEKDPFFESRSDPPKPTATTSLEDNGQEVIYVDGQTESDELLLQLDRKVFGSINDLDRSAWPTVTFGEGNGRTWHYPTYFGDVDRGEDQISPLEAPRFQWRIDEAMSGDSAANFSSQNLVDSLVKPVDFGINIMLLPIRAVLHRPWSHTTTPSDD